jgi:outer membrane protein insertion porin family
VQFTGFYTQKSTGGNLVFGFPVADFSRMFVNYSYERTGVSEFNELFFNPRCSFEVDGCTTISPSDVSSIDPDTLDSIRRNPFLFDSLLLGAGGKRTISKVTPSFVHNTVDNPMFPTTGRRFTASLDLAVIGGNINFYKPRLESIWYLQHTRRTSFGFRAMTEFIAPVMGTDTLPIFEKLFLGGEYSIRGYDIRSIGPSLPDRPGLVLGGNKSLLFNAEYLIQVAGPVRLVLFYDAGQVRDEGERFSLREDVIEPVLPPTPALSDPFASSVLRSVDDAGQQFRVVGRRSAFKTSTGAEIRFFMPVLNVPFRLIFAMNPQRGGVLDNNLQPAKKFTFRFAVGSTF